MIEKIIPHDEDGPTLPKFLWWLVGVLTVIVVMGLGAWGTSIHNDIVVLQDRSNKLEQGIAAIEVKLDLILANQHLTPDRPTR